MSEYIDKDALMETLKNAHKRLIETIGYTRHTIGFEGAMDYVEEAPLADVAEVKHGRWINSKAGGVLCSECYSYAPNVEKGSFTTRRIEQEKSAYCPNCGAKMDGEEQ